MIFTPGPTALHPAVPGEAAAAFADGYLSESHRSPRFRAEVQRTVEALRALLGVPAEHRILFTGSASEAMERIVAGVVRRRSFHLVNGAFARRFHEIATNLGKEAGHLAVWDGAGFDAEVPFPDGTELVALTQNETSTGARIPPARVHGLADRAHEAGALVAVDLVTGWPVEPVDPARIDAGFFSVQKAFGLPAGLGVIVAGPALIERAHAVQAGGGSIGGYLHLPALIEAADRNETVATPNMLAIRLLGRVAEAYLEEGTGATPPVAALARAAQAKADSFWAAVDNIEGVRPFVSDPETRSRTILAMEVGASGSLVRAALRRRGLVVGGGYGLWKERHLRVANFPVQSPAMMEALVAGLEAVMAETHPGNRGDGS